MSIDKMLYVKMALLGAVFLTGCDTFSNKTPLAGQREAVIVLDSTTKPDASLSGKVPLYPSAQNRADWSQPGGNAQNALPVLAFGKAPKKVWQASIGRGSDENHKLITTPVYSDGMILVMDADSTVTALKATNGQEVWSVRTMPQDVDSHALGGGVSCHQGTAYVATAFGEVFALDQKTGTQKWKKTISNPSRVAPFIHNEHLFVMTIANEIHALSPQTGDVVWSHQGLTELTGMLGTATPAASGALLVVPYSSGEVFALRSENGFVAWSDTLTTALSVDSISSIPHVRARPVIVDEHVYLISHGGKLASLELSTGIRTWQKEFSGIHTPAVLGDSLFIVTVPNELLALNRHTGDVYWAVNLPKSADKKYISWTGPLPVTDRLVVCGSNGQILFMSPCNGSIIQSCTENDTFTQTPLVVNETMYLLGESGTLYAYK